MGQQAADMMGQFQAMAGRPRPAGPGPGQAAITGMERQPFNLQAYEAAVANRIPPGGDTYSGAMAAAMRPQLTKFGPTPPGGWGGGAVGPAGSPEMVKQAQQASLQASLARRRTGMT